MLISLRSFTTLFVIIDIDEEIVNWMSQRSSREFAHCSWLIAIQKNPTVAALVKSNVEGSEKDVILEQSSIFRSLKGKQFYIIIDLLIYRYNFLKGKY